MFFTCFKELFSDHRFIEIWQAKGTVSGKCGWELWSVRVHRHKKRRVLYCSSKVLFMSIVLCEDLADEEEEGFWCCRGRCHTLGFCA